MTSTPPPPPNQHNFVAEDGATARTGASGKVLQAALWIVVAAILGQAALAGMFLSGISGARFAHLIVGWILPYVAIAVAVAAGVAHSRGSCRPAVAIATYPLPVLLWVQEVLGHVPAAATTAVHIPFGVALAVYAAMLAISASHQNSRR